MEIMSNSKDIRKQMDKIKNLGMINESKVPTADSPYGYYNIDNALKPDELFEKLDDMGIKHTYDFNAAQIKVMVDDIEDAKKVRTYVLDHDIFDAVAIDDDDLLYIEDYGLLEIKKNG
jgi:hypothetical protein